jgi:hypothetical protein
MAEMIISNWHRIEDAAANQARPFQYRIRRRGSLEPLPLMPLPSKRK